VGATGLGVFFACALPPVLFDPYRVHGWPAAMSVIMFVAWLTAVCHSTERPVAAVAFCCIILLACGIALVFAANSWGPYEERTLSLA
jgi:hypothetical protein